MKSRRITRLWLCVNFCLLAALTEPTSHGQAEEPYPPKGDAPLEKIGGLVSIPGYPLPPPSREAAEDAIPIYEAILSGVRLFGEGPTLARGEGYLAGLYAAVGNFSKAESLYEKALRILEKHGTTGRDLAWVNNNRGLARLDQKRYAEAVSSFQAASQALRSSGRDLLEPRAITLQNLAAAYLLLGDVDAAEATFLDGLDVLRQQGLERERVGQTIRQNLAGLYSSIGDFAAARQLLADLAVEEIRDPNLRFAVLNNLGEALRGLKEFSAAEKRLREALALAGAGSRNQVLVLHNLVVVYADAGDFVNAQHEGKRVLQMAGALDGSGSLLTASIETTLGTVALARGDLQRADELLTRASRILARTSGSQQQALAGATQVLAIVAQRQGQHERALELSRGAFDLETRNLDRILAFGSEAQRLAYRRNAYPYDHAANLGEAALLTEAVLGSKGVVLDSLLEERALARKSTRVEDRARLDRIHALKISIQEEIARGGSNPRRGALERELKQEETALAKRFGRAIRSGQSRPSLAQIQAALGSGQVLIEILRFQNYQEGGKLTPWYGAVLIPGSGRPTWLPLGEAARIEQTIDRLMERMGVGNRGARSASPEADMTLQLRTLYDSLWKPLAAAFPAGTRNVVLSPDGALHLVPWAALPDENEVFAAERWQISQVGAGRDLLRQAPVSEKTLLALADGTGDLPFSQSEVEDLVRRAGTLGWRARALVGDQVDEKALFQEPGPRILHLATHGGQLQGDLARAVESRLSRWPMYRGFLLLGGAKKSLEAWKRGQVPPLASDGILTAEEVGGLDLGRTWLTVLSACQTGAGETRDGEGVLGLRRGFALAGTRHLIFTLWPVDDRSTAEFMSDFYERLFRSSDPTLAFHEAQVAKLRQLKQLHGIPGTVFRAGGLVLTR